MKKTEKLKKILCMIIMAAAFVLIFASCAPEVSDISTELVKDDGSMVLLAGNSAVDFYFYYPENWTIHRNDAMIIIQTNDTETLETDVPEGLSGEPLAYITAPNISAQVFSLLEGYATVDDYWDNFAAPSLRQIFQDVEDDASEELTVGGTPAKKYTYTLSLSGMRYKISQVIFFRQRQVYTLTYTATEGKYDTYAGTLDAVAESFVFK